VSLLSLTNTEAARHFEADVTRIPRNELRKRPSQADEVGRVAA
jgi:hypothetical protein